MFLEILKTVAKLGLLLLIFIIAFGLGFHIMLSEQVQEQDYLKILFVL